MITSVLFVDVQSLQARVGGTPAPSTLVAELTETMHGLQREFRHMNAYCAPSVDLTTRNAYRDAGFEIFDTSGTDETLIRVALDVAGALSGPTDFEEAIFIGRSNYSALARMLKTHNKLVSVSDRTDMPPSLEAIADGIVDLDDIVASRIKQGTPAIRKSVVSEPKPAPAIAKKDDASDKNEKAEKPVEAKPAKPETESADTQPDPKKEPVLVAAGAGAASVAVAAVSEALSISEEPDDVGADANKVAEVTEEIEQLANVDEQVAEDEAPEVEASAEPVGTSEFKESEPEEALAASDDTKVSEPADAEASDADAEDIKVDAEPETVAAKPDAEQKPPAKPQAVDDALEAAIEAELDLTDPASEPSIEAAPAPEPRVQATISAQAAPEPSVGKVDTDPLDGEVDELLSKLISDGLHASHGETAPKLDVVPER